MAEDPTNLKDVLLDNVSKVLGSEGVEALPAEAPKSDDSESKESLSRLPELPICTTQSSIPVALQNEGVISLVIGFEAELRRWQRGSVVKWAAWRLGFDSQEDANFAASHMYTATQKWNEADVGVTFEWVDFAKDANFVLCHGGPKGTVLAEGYFPNGRDLNFVKVFSYAFTSKWRDHIWQVFLHELGHVIGLRHEFALDPAVDDKGNVIPNKLREGDGVQIGPRNEKSVMNYRREPPEIQQSDIDSTKYFYSLKNGTELNGTPVVDYAPK